MAHPKSIDSYNDELGLLDDALAQERGLRITFDNEKDAFARKMRLYAARKAAARLHEEVHPGVPSAYSSLTISQEGPVLIIRKVNMRSEPL